MILFIIIGVLLVLCLSLMIVNHAVENAVEGHEDAAGFHQKTSGRPAESFTALEDGISIMDRIEGACCQLDNRPSLRGLGSPPLSPPSAPWQPPR